MIDDLVRAYCAKNGLRMGTGPENRAAMRIHRAGLRLEPQYRVGRYRLDFADPDRRVAVEVDGPFHRQPPGALRDANRDAWLRARGWVIFRVTAGETMEAELARVCEILHGIPPISDFIIANLDRIEAPPTCSPGWPRHRRRE